MEPELDWTASALFSPSKARQQQAQAKDWSFVEIWLTRRYGAKRLPVIERNEETLQTLLSLATFCESAEEQRAALDKVEKAALRACSKPGSRISKDIEAVVADHLDEAGTRSLDSLGQAAVELDAPQPDMATIATKAISLTTINFELGEQLRKVERQRSTLKSEQHRLRNILEQLKNDAFQPAADLPERISEWQQGSKHMKAKLGEYDERLAALRASKPTGPTIDDILHQREELARLQDRLNHLDAELKAYQDLPSDARAAQKVLQQSREDLRQLMLKRDRLFEDMVST